MADSFSKQSCGNCIHCYSGRCLKTAPESEFHGKYRLIEQEKIKLYPEIPEEKWCKDWFHNNSF